MNPTKSLPIFDFERRNAELPALRQRYQTAHPFPHIVMEDFLDTQTLDTVLEEFPPINSGTWIHYIHFNEKKHGKNKLEEFKPTIQSIIKELNSEPFVKWLSELTGIEGLFADNALEGGGLHQSERGGFLNIHADFMSHPHHRDWRRRVNVLVYLNKGWQDSYGGHLELWEKDMSKYARKVAPIFNRAVIFNTDSDSFHGHPEPMTCPEDVTRKSIALYYFTKEKTLSSGPVSTEYRPRPQDGAKGILIHADKWFLRGYDRIKRLLKLNDDFASKWLGRVDKFFNKRK